MCGVLVWSAGLGVSVVLNGALVVALAAAVAPDPPPEQAVSEAALDIESYPVPQSTATESRAEGAALPESGTGGLRAGGQAVPQSRAEAAPLSAALADPVSSQGDMAPATAPPAGRVEEVSPTGAVAPATAPPAGRVEEVSPTGAVAPATAPPAGRVEGVSPAGAVATATAPPAGRVEGVSPDGAVAAATAPAGAAVPSLSLPGNGVGAQPLPRTALAPGTPVFGAPVTAERAASLRLRPETAEAGVATPVRPDAGKALAVPAAPTAPMAQVIAPPAAPGVALTASGDAVPTVRPPGAPVPPTAGGGQPVLSASPQSVPLSAATPVAAVQGAGALSAPLLAMVAAPQDVVLGADAVRGETAPSHPGAATRVATVAAPAAMTAALAPEAEAPGAIPADGGVAVPALSPPGVRQTAALAWSGGGDAALSDLSLAAIQAFSRADDPESDGPRVRDGIARLLSEVPCARLQTVFDPADGALELRGHIPDAGLRGPVLAALAAQVGEAIPLRDTMLILPRPQCGALAAIESVGLAQSSDQEGDPRVVGEQPFAAVSRFSEGERVFFAFEGPDYPAHVYVDYFDAGGQVLHVQPNELVPLRQVAPQERLPVGLDEDGAPALDIRVTPPFGQEIVVTFASSAPLFDGLRPMIEPAAPYLEDLRAAVERAKAENPDFQGEWFYFFVVTEPAP